jgi:surface carbohydrate biosynthesis protein
MSAGTSLRAPLSRRRRPILFPIETINRELDFRLMLAVLFASPTRRIFIGQHDAMHDLVPSMHGGVYVGKNIFRTPPPTDLATYHMLKNQGFAVTYLHEEGAFFRGQESDWRRRMDSQFDPRVFGTDDLICTWGSFQSGHVQERAPNLVSRVRVTGHPRFDLYKPTYRGYLEQDAAAIRRKHGRFVLINTNLALANHGRGLQHVFAGSMWPQENGDAQRRHIDAWANNSRVLASLVSLVSAMANDHPDVAFIVRPHPSENHGLYRTVFAATPNVHVIHEGPVGPWLLAAAAMIHDGCTTAVEAQLAGTPVLTFQPAQDPRFDSYVPNLMGHQCGTDDEARRALSTMLEGDSPSTNDELPERALGLLYNFEHDSFAALLAAMTEAEGCVRGNSRSPRLAEVQRQHLARRARLAVRRPAYRFSPAAARRHAYHHTKFYGFSRPVVHTRLERIQQMLNKRVTARQMSDQLIVIDG